MRPQLELDGDEATAARASVQVTLGSQLEPVHPQSLAPCTRTAQRHPHPPAAARPEALLLLAMSSLAAQLQARQTVDSARLSSTRALKNIPSFIYTSRHASTLTTADLHSLAANAWDQLSALDPFFGLHFKEILGEQAKSLDRTGLTKDENDKVGRSVDKVLRALGKHMLLKPAGVVLEWLVRRFRCVSLSLSSNPRPTASAKS